MGAGADQVHRLGCVFMLWSGHPVREERAANVAAMNAYFEFPPRETWDAARRPKPEAAPEQKKSKRKLARFAKDHEPEEVRGIVPDELPELLCLFPEYDGDQWEKARSQVALRTWCELTTQRTLAQRWYGRLKQPELKAQAEAEALQEPPARPVPAAEPVPEAPAPPPDMNANVRMSAEEERAFRESALRTGHIERVVEEPGANA